MDQVFLSAFNGELIVTERRKKIKQNRQENENVLYQCKQLFPASSLPVRRGASDNFPAKN